MTNKAIQLIKGVESAQIEDFQLNEFLLLLEEESEKKEKQNALNYLLRVKAISPDQGEILAKAQIIQRSIDLLYILKGYVSTQKYRCAETDSKNESAWITLLYLLGSM